MKIPERLHLHKKMYVIYLKSEITAICVKVILIDTKYSDFIFIFFFLIQAG